MLFNAGCNKQVFAPKFWKKIWRRSVLSISRKTQKTHSLIPKMASPSRRLRYS